MRASAFMSCAARNARRLAPHLGAISVLTLASSACLAGTTGTEFEQLYNMLSDWATGYLGRSIALVFLLIGLGIGVVRGSLLAAAGSIAVATALLIAPTVVEGILSALI